MVNIYSPARRSSQIINYFIRKVLVHAVHQLQGVLPRGNFVSISVNDSTNTHLLFSLNKPERSAGVRTEQFHYTDHSVVRQAELSL